MRRVPKFDRHLKFEERWSGSMCPNCGASIELKQGAPARAGQAIECPKCHIQLVQISENPVDFEILDYLDVPGRREENEQPKGPRAGAAPAAPPPPVTPEDRVLIHITSFPGVRFMDVEALLGLSKSEAEKTLQDLVQAGKIRKKEDRLYYPT